MTAQAAGRPELTGRESATLEAICSYVDMHGYPPSMWDLCGALKLASPSTVMRILNRLQAKGYVQRDPVRARTIRIVR
jgi:repressor LexA